MAILPPLPFSIKLLGQKQNGIKDKHNEEELGS